MKQSKVYEVKLNVIWYCQAESDVEAEQNAIDAFCLEDAPSCSTWDLNVSEMVNLESIKNQKNDMCKLVIIEEMLEGTSQPQILNAMKDLVEGIDSELEVVKLISKYLLEKIEQKIKEVEGSGI